MSGANPFQSSSDPQDFIKQFWGGLNIPIPGMVTPTLDTNELEKRITDLKAVEGWLKMNLNMLQMSIQGLEMQKMTLSAMQAMSQPSADGASNPFASAALNPALWPWNFMTGNPADAASPSEATKPTAETSDTPPSAESKKSR
ncbi:MAG TPA: PhaM family polyhydroxyalkanoate granule multifunctional regulatory protein [Rhodocyclaceae bacterium]|jgi:hypothetical protein